jgi:hypothetical protein
MGVRVDEAREHRKAAARKPRQIRKVTLKLSGLAHGRDTIAPDCYGSTVEQAAFIILRNNDRVGDEQFHRFSPWTLCKHYSTVTA